MTPTNRTGYRERERERRYLHNHPPDICAQYSPAPNLRIGASCLLLKDKEGEREGILLLSLSLSFSLPLSRVCSRTLSQMLRLSDPQSTMPRKDGAERSAAVVDVCLCIFAPTCVYTAPSVMYAVVLYR